MSSTEADRAAIAARHHHHDPAVAWCDFDLQDWPCDTVRALALPPDPERLTRALDAVAHDGLLPRYIRPRANYRPVAAAIIAAWEPKP